MERLEAEKSKSSSSKKDAKKKKKTANRLDERFQIGPEHDPDHIFDEEMEMITRLRSEIEDLRFYSDKWVCYFLFSRRHDYDSVKDLLQKYLKTRADFGWRTCSPIFTEDSLRSDRSYTLQSVSNSFVMHILTLLCCIGFMYRPHGVVDKEGRMILWLYLGGARPHGRKFQDLMGYAMWEVDYVVETETLARLRNGFVWVIDLTNFSLLKNADLSSDGRKWTAAVSGALPNRVRSIWIMKAGWMFRAIMAAAKLLFPKKMTKRFKMITEADLQELVPRVRFRLFQSAKAQN